MRGPDHAADAPIHVFGVHRISGELPVVRGDLFSRDDTTLNIGGHFPPSHSRILRAKQAAEIGHGPDFLRVRGMSDDVFDPAAAARAKRVPSFHRQGRSRDQEKRKQTHKLDQTPEKLPSLSAIG